MSAIATAQMRYAMMAEGPRIAATAAGSAKIPDPMMLLTVAAAS
jgi:hypothetical protein